jgi:hypothetical protein
MSQGKDILTLVQNIQKLNAEIAALIKTCDKMFSHGKFPPDESESKAVVRDSSASLDLPQRWTPTRMCRIYKNAGDKDDVIVLNIVLDSHNHPEAFDEPLVLCARFGYQKGQANQCSGWWDARDLWVYKAATETNRVYTKKELNLDPDKFLAPSEWQKREVDAMRDIRFLAVPLATLVDQKVLDEKVIRRML